MLALWLMLLFPLAGAAVNGLLLRKAGKTVSHLVGSGALVASAACALVLFVQYLGAGEAARTVLAFEWLEAGSFSAPFQFVVDRLSTLMMLVVTVIGSLIHIYAGGYMHEEKATWRFFAYLNLFVFMMLMLVMGDNMLVMFIGWEGVGLCSYLLIGYWYEDDNNAAAGMKAFLVNRIGDIGFLIGIFLTYKTFGTVAFSELRQLIVNGDGLTAMQIAAVGWITLALFIGACGKSAQLPLYVWLPDAMAGPTPVSALIHAATMVTAGIYMMTRLNFMYYLAPSTQAVVAAVGAATALFAATIALVQYDIKKVLAYSTVSQLGYMVLGCGVGAYSAGVFHLFTHACFKALLFLGAGSVIVAMHHKQDMREMGGLRKYMPVTHAVMLIGVLAIIGFPGLAGFFSKDEILFRAYTSGGPTLWLIGAAAALCTSFYMVRMLRLTFYGANRADHHTQEHLHETPWHMWAPLVVLAAASVVVGYLNVPHVIPFPVHLAFEHWLEPVIAIPSQATGHWTRLTAQYPHSLEWALMGASTLGMFLAAGFAWTMYGNGFSPLAHGVRERFSRIHKVLSDKYYVDEFYFASIVNPLRDVSMFLWRIVDTVIIDGIVNGIGQACMLAGGLLSFKSTGSVHRHGMIVMVGILCMLSVLLWH